MNRKIILPVLIIFLQISAFAQEDEKAIDYSLPAPDWKTGLKKGKVEGWLYSSDEEDQSERMTSSSLDKYLPSSLSDRNTATAWAEGSDGPGIGEVVVTEYNPYQDKGLTLWIWGGYGKSSALFLANNRPRKIRLYLLGTFCHDCTPRICMIGNFVVLESLEQELKDLNGFQELKVPQLSIKDNTADCNGLGGHDNDPDHFTYKVGIEILSVYNGSKYNDTCITEIMDGENYKEWLKTAKVRK